MHKEIEIKFQLDEDLIDVIESKLKEIGTVQELEEFDTYFVKRGEKIDPVKLNSVIRTRKSNIGNSVTMKLLENSYWTEIESEIEDVDAINSIFSFMQFEPGLKIEKKRLSVKTDDDVVINLDRIKGLGIFIELEIIAQSEEGCIKKLEKHAKDFGFSMKQEVGDGYVQLCLYQQARVMKKE